MTTFGKTSARTIQLAERRGVVVSLRLQGGSFRDIAAQLHTLPAEDKERLGITDAYCEVHAYRDCVAELKRLNDKAQEGIAEVKRLELERLDALLAAWWDRSLTDPLAFDKVLTIMDRIERLWGIGVPKLEHTGTVTQVQMSLAEWQKQVAERRAAAREAEALAGVV